MFFMNFVLHILDNYIENLSLNLLLFEEKGKYILCNVNV